MRSALPRPAAARAWIVDLLSTAARQQENQWWHGYDDHGDPAIHGMPFRRLRNRTGLARLVLDTRVQLRISQQTLVDACRVVQGDVQAWECGTRIPTDAELAILAHLLGLDRARLAGAETGSALYRNNLSADQQAELDTLYWASDAKAPDLVARFGVEGRLIYKLVTAVPAGVKCERCGVGMVFTARDRRVRGCADCLPCGVPRYFGRRGTPAR
jgi:transcriptional regulator with XRE-family HTH domain